MKHLIKVSIFVEVDMDHPTYPKDETRDIDVVVQRARETFQGGFESGGKVSGGTLFAGCQVELVE